MESAITKVPVHVSVIMDGNGRWAKERGKERIFGHMNGVESVRAVTEESVAQGVKYLSLYAFSEENWNRPPVEVNALMALMLKFIRQEFSNLMEHRVRFMALGNRSRLSKEVNAAIDDLMEASAGNQGTTLIVFLSYSGQWDVLQAMKKAAAELSPEAFQAMEAKDFSGYLVTAGIPDPDLLIRTSGELRISNYLLWQCAYSEFYFTDVLWPDFRRPQFQEALDAYANRDRRYGKVK